MKRKTMGIRLDPRIRERLERLADEKGLAPAEVARALLAEGLTREEDSEARRRAEATP